MDLSTNEQGQNVVEFAMVMMLLTVITFAIVQFSLVVMAYNTIANAAREGARAGIVPRPTPATRVASMVAF